MTLAFGIIFLTEVVIGIRFAPVIERIFRG